MKTVIHKLISVVLVCVMLTTLFLPVANAAAPTLTVGSASAKPGETVSVPVTVSGNPGINSFSLAFDYDASQLNLTNVEAAQELGGQFTYAKKAVWLNSEDSDYNGTILTLTFAVLPDAKAGTVTVTAVYGEGEIINRNEDDVAFKVVPGSITIQKNEHTTHTWDAGIITTAATCIEKGVKTFTCSVCKETKTEPVEIDPANHADYGTEVKDAKAADCVNEGYTGDTVCKGCGAVRTKGKAIPATGHNYKEIKAENGILYYECTGCGDIQKTKSDVKLPNLCDVDGNGKVESADARLALRTSVKLEPTIVEGTDAYMAADVNGDKKIGSDDARTILRLTVKLETMDNIMAKYGKKNNVGFI